MHSSSPHLLHLRTVTPQPLRPRLKVGTQIKAQHSGRPGHLEASVSTLSSGCPVGKVWDSPNRMGHFPRLMLYLKDPLHWVEGIRNRTAVCRKTPTLRALLRLFQGISVPSTFLIQQKLKLPPKLATASSHQVPPSESAGTNEGHTRIPPQCHRQKRPRAIFHAPDGGEFRTSAGDHLPRARCTRAKNGPARMWVTGTQSCTQTYSTTEHTRTRLNLGFHNSAPTHFNSAF